MPSQPVKEGEKIPLRFQLHDYATDRIVKAEFRDMNGDAYGSAVTLAHANNGLYLDDSVDMPDETVVATYLVYEPPGGTVIDDTYGSDEDTFYLPLSELTLVQIQAAIDAQTATLEADHDTLESNIDTDIGESEAVVTNAITSQTSTLQGNITSIETSINNNVDAAEVAILAAIIAQTAELESYIDGATPVIDFSEVLAAIRGSQLADMKAIISDDTIKCIIDDDEIRIKLYGETGGI